MTPGSQKTKSLLEIQEQEERERREKEEVRGGVQLGKRGRYYVEGCLKIIFD